jgi:ABC-type amino acid transport substrate-binding protein
VIGLISISTAIENNVFLFITLSNCSNIIKVNKTKVISMRLLAYATFITALALSNQALSEPLRFSYWSDASPPLASIQDNKLHAGILKELGAAIGAALNLPVEFRALPVQRIESQLQAGLIDLDCITSPIWKQEPEAYHWSPVLFKGADRFLIKKGSQHAISTFSDLKGLTLGIYNGYTYHPKIMEMINSGDVATIKVSGIEHGIQLIELGRLDALIDFEVSLNYQIKQQNLYNKLKLAEKYADEFDLQCAYSKKMKISTGTMNKAIESIVRSGKFQEILAKYK